MEWVVLLGAAAPDLRSGDVCVSERAREVSLSGSILEAVVLYVWEVGAEKVEDVLGRSGRGGEGTNNGGVCGGGESETTASDIAGLV